VDFIFFQSQCCKSSDGGINGENGIRHRYIKISSSSTNRQISGKQISAINAAADRIGRGENAYQLDGTLHVHISQGLCRVVAVLTVQGIRHDKIGIVVTFLKNISMQCWLLVSSTLLNNRVSRS